MHIINGFLLSYVHLTFLESQSLSVSGIQKLVDDLQAIRKDIITNFELEDGRKKTVTEKSKWNDESDFS